MKTHRLWIEGKWRTSTSRQAVMNPFTGDAVASAELASSDLLQAATSASVDAFRSFRRTSRYARSRLLLVMARMIRERSAEFTASIVEEAGKPVTMAEIEVQRAIGTFTIASEEAKRLGGEVVPIDIEPSGLAFDPVVWHWVARGPVLAISPFNFPLNLVAHKVAPALAVGASIVLKPPHQAPGAAQLLAQVFESAVVEVSDSRDAIPLSAFQLVHASNETMEAAIKDPRYGILTFTGSDRVGFRLRDLAGHKRVLLELGGNAAVIVDRDADIERAAHRCAYGAFSYAGQVCISVQRILVHREVEVRFREAFLAEIRRLSVGDPGRKETVIGPLIDAKSADRLMEWISSARSAGAELLAGGIRQGNQIDATVLTSVPADHPLVSEEAFGPVAVIEVFGSLKEAIARVNASRFGLQAGIFTNQIRSAQEASTEIDAGGIVINDVPTFRADNMPYGGVKDSGIGREGLRYAMEEYCERKTIVTWKG